MAESGFNNYIIQNDIALIELTDIDGKIIDYGIIDKDCLPVLISLGYRWSIHYEHKNKYAYVTNSWRNILLHDLIMDASKEELVDHIDHNGLNNRKSNLRICTPSQNGQNKIMRRRPHSSKYKGVYLDKYSKKWRAELEINGKRVYLGCFYTEKDAAIAYNNAAIYYFGEFAYPNVIEEGCDNE